MTEAEYTIRIDKEGVRSPHDRLIRMAESASQAKKWDGDTVECEGDNDAVEDLLEYVVYLESRNESR